MSHDSRRRVRPCRDTHLVVEDSVPTQEDLVGLPLQKVVAGSPRASGVARPSSLLESALERAMSSVGIVSGDARYSHGGRATRFVVANHVLAMMGGHLQLQSEALLCRSLNGNAKQGGHRSQTVP